MAVAMESDETVRVASERASLVWISSLKGEINSDERMRRLEEIAEALRSEQAEIFWKTLPSIRDQALRQVTRERPNRNDD